jgi:hypothetical protein
MSKSFKPIHFHSTILHRCLSTGSVGRVITKPFPLGSIIDLNEGDYFQLNRTFTGADVETFANLVGDHNPIHKAETQVSPFGKPIIHGWLTSSLFSNLFGQMIPGGLHLHRNRYHIHSTRSKSTDFSTY